VAVVRSRSKNFKQTFATSDDVGVGFVEIARVPGVGNTLDFIEDSHGVCTTCDIVVKIISENTVAQTTLKHIERRKYIKQFSPSYPSITQAIVPPFKFVQMCCADV